MSYSRIFGTSGCVTNTTCSTDCYNVTSPDQNSTKPTIYDDLTVSVPGLAAAVEVYADQLARRLGCRYTVRAPSTTQFVIGLSGSKTAEVTWNLDNVNGAYPLTVSYTYRQDSESLVSFGHVNHAIDWLVQRLA